MSDRRERLSLAVVAASYFALFAFLALPWLGKAATTVPLTSDPYDAQLIVWLLAWVAHALATQPLHLFDAPINYPAPAQLTGSEHLLSTQLLFAPLVGLTGNALLAANLVVLLSYPLGALAMERLLRALGCGAVAAWVGGALFVLGSPRVPMNLQTLQYPNLWFPLVALALVRLRDEPGFGRAALLALAFAGGIASSYYMAVMLGIMAALWGAFEVVRRAPGRLRFALLAAGGALAATALLALVLRPYLQRAGSEVPGKMRILPPLATLAHQQLDLVMLERQRAVMAGLELIAIVAALRIRGLRRMVIPGLAIAVAGFLLASGTPRSLLGWARVSPLAFFRRTRFITLAGFGLGLLCAAGLEAVRRALGRGAALAAALAVAVLVLLPKCLTLTSFDSYPVAAIAQSSTVYRTLAQLAPEPGGAPTAALLELPISRPWRKDDPFRGLFAKSLEPDAMVGSTLHWLPLLTGYTGYQARQRNLVLRLVGELPGEGALEDLIDMTHLGWILVRPAGDWPTEAERASFLSRLSRSPSVGRTWELDGFTLVRLDRKPEHPEWFAALARGPLPGQSLLGTPLAPLAADQAIARVELAGATSAGEAPPAASSARAGSLLGLELRVSNTGRTDWPVALQPRSGLRLNWTGRPEPIGRGAVCLAARWRALDPASARDPASPAVLLPLRRDLPAGESLAQQVAVRTPSAPGRYQLEIAVKQLDGARFETPGDEPLRLELEVSSG